MTFRSELTPMKLLVPSQPKQKPQRRQQTLPGLEEPITEQLRETLSDFLAEACVEREQGLVRNVALLGPTSRNGYRYTAEAMRQAVPLYAGRPVFIDHAATPPAYTGSSPQVRRSVRDYAGKVLNPRFEENRVRGDLHLLGPNAGWLLHLIEAAPNDIGMSHVVLARRNSSGDEVEHIERVLSVDIVAFPATTQSFQENEQDAGNHRGLLTPEASSSLPTGNPAAVVAEHDRLLPFPKGPARSVAAGWGPATPEGLRRLVEQSRIPPLGRTAALDQLLQMCPDPQLLLTLLESYWQQVLTETPHSLEKPSPEQTSGGLRPPLAEPHIRQAVIAAIRGR